MNVSNLLAGGPAQADAEPSRGGYVEVAQHHNHTGGHHTAQYAPSETQVSIHHQRSGSAHYGGSHGVAMSPGMVQAKNVRFELLVDPSHQQRARLPMRIGIQKHDALADISETVKNFYGLYDGGMSFEDRNGQLLIPTFDNVEDKMLIYVRTIRDENEESNGSRTPRAHSRATRNSLSPRKLQPPFQMMPPNSNHGYSISRPSSRNDRNRSRSPQSGRGRRSESAHTNPKSKSRSLKKLGSFDLGANDSDSDGVDGSVASSRRSKNDMLASAEISVDNIVEGGRRKRAKFDSSELPLFVPPQVPTAASLSSVSPQRRVGSQPNASPYSHSNQHTFTYTQPLPSPQNYGAHDLSYGHNRQVGAMPGNIYNRNLRARAPVQYVPTRHGINGTVLPTPDPTIGGSMSVISDEDVALQLMRLGDASNFSSTGRTSTSTLDDAFSGKADAASSIEESSEESDDEEDLPSRGAPVSHHHHHHPANGYDQAESSGEEDDPRGDSSFKADSDPILPDEQGFIRPKPKKPRLDTTGHKPQVGATGMKNRNGTSHKSAKPKGPSSVASGPQSGAPMSPASLNSSRKPSNASANPQFMHPLGPDEEDLSAKPRCQRCRKSKKGCDRQRPCGRCKDAGIGIEGCVSEDEGNGRKGRYGRHMGVTIKKEGSLENLRGDDVVMTGAVNSMVAVGGMVTAAMMKQLPPHPHQNDYQYAPPQHQPHHHHQQNVPAYMPAPIGMNDKSKKRKR